MDCLGASRVSVFAKPGGLVQDAWFAGFVVWGEFELSELLPIVDELGCAVCGLLAWTESQESFSDRAIATFSKCKGGSR